MPVERLQDRAVLYVSGAMTAAEREGFDVVLQFHEGLRAQVAGLQEAAAAVLLAPALPRAEPPAALRARLLDTVEKLPAAPEPAALVVTGPGGLVEWVNPAFTAMCGYSLAELRGRKPGGLLQGPDTDAGAVARIRAAVRERRPCRETLVNYHKDGGRYRADIRLSPVLDDDGQPLWFVAQERKLPEGEAGAPVNFDRAASS